MTPRILIAEDNVINQKLMGTILTRAGYEYDLVADGEAAVQAVRGHAYDLVLMDCQMPIMDGLTATRKIRQLDIRQPTIIAVTARALPDDRENCCTSGMNDFVRKPFQPASLLDLIRQALTTKRDELSAACA